ncbi:molybdopterin synthase subunit MoaE [Haloactinospora alba]|uniref:Molybdopterin synthase catalytic subunit 1 n=1 Tax=Haloactinospora alba TaxID=405555 RepID=A0A543NFH0_9ACTN|nr:molybdenum cofactor biosynthesis protein MoaE [Haloactinospora alba]TQN30500.1 molybdopterin synthase subunit MoaE [Haloactinospora alba]
METITLVGLRESPLSVDEVLSSVGDPEAGGTAFFLGTVRDHDHGRGVRNLTYEAHPRAERDMRGVLERVVADFADTGRPVRKVAALHRVGPLAIGDTAVVVAAAAAHREEAFSACRRLIDDIKDEVPIWKHQEFADGETEWVGAC